MIWKLGVLWAGCSTEIVLGVSLYLRLNECYSFCGFVLNPSISVALSEIGDGAQSLRLNAFFRFWMFSMMGTSLSSLFISYLSCSIVFVFGNFVVYFPSFCCSLLWGSYETLFPKFQTQNWIFSFPTLGYILVNRVIWVAQVVFLFN